MVFMSSKSCFNGGILEVTKFIGLLELINEILDLSKIEAGKMDVQLEKIILNDLCQNMKGVFGPLAKEKKIKYNSTIDENVATTTITDRIRLEQVIKNLLSNALKFTSKGEIKLHIFIPPKRMTFNNPNLKPGKVVAYAVSDSGIGIPKDKQALVFEAFQQADGSTRRQYGGTGLGLSISREIANLLGGEIRLISKENEGSTFTLYLPIDSTDVVSESDKKDNPSKRIKFPTSEIKDIDVNVMKITPDEIPDDRNNLTDEDKVILIVEDDVHFAKVLIKFTHERGYKAVVAVSGGKALEYAKKYHPTGILLDIQLPEKSGWTIMKELKEDRDTRYIPVHMMSSLDVSRKESVDVGAIDFMNKPLAEKQIQSVFDTLERSNSNYPKRILLIEDNAAHQMALKAYLEDADKECICAFTAKEGMEILKKERIDCIILDMGLPDETGYEVLEKIRKQKKFETLPIIIYTGKSLSLNEEQKIKKYASTIVIKTAESYQRITDEVSLFLHLMEKKDEKGTEIKRKPYIKEEALSNKNVLVVDDDIRNIFSMTKTLESQKMNVLSANNGKEALAVLKDNPEIELVLMDMMMPEMDGYETMQAMRKEKQWEKVPVIAVTAKAMLGDRDKCIQAGASDYISKPVDSDQLTSLLRVWLNKK